MVCSLGEMSARGGLFTRGAENAKYYKLNTSIYTSLCIVMNKDNIIYVRLTFTDPTT